jgi:hypothetical protein
LLIFHVLFSAGCVLLPTLGGPPPKLDAGEKSAPPTLLDLRGVVHCHSFFSHDSEGTIDEIAAAARATGVRFVAMTDHYTPRAVAEGFCGEKEGVFFLVGAEISRDRGSILAVGLGTVRDPPARFDRTEAAIDAAHAAGGLAFLGHAERFSRWDVARSDGVEVFNLHAAANRRSWAFFLFGGLFLPPGTFFRAMIERPNDVLARWDGLCRNRRVAAVGGCDAHENVRLFGPLGGRVGTYEECFRAVTTHVLVPRATPQAILEALREGRSYVAFEIAGDATGFSFELFDERGNVAARMGEEIPWAPGFRLAARAPGEARVRLFCDGDLFAEASAGGLEVAARAPGVYRVECTLGDELFVISNPIYLRGK